MFHTHKKTFFSTFVHKCVYIPVSELLCQDLPPTWNVWHFKKLITQVHLVLGAIKDHSEICHFVTQHNVTNVSNWGCEQLVCWLQECPPELLPDNWMCIPYHKPPPMSFWRIWQEFDSTSDLPHNHRPRVWLRMGDVNVVNRVPLGGVMVWAGISYGQWTQLHFIDGNLNAQRYPGDVLRPTVFPFIRHHYLMFQYDNAQSQVARIWSQFLEAENVPVLPWPAYSPDMSPIELVWDALDWRVQQRVPLPANIQQLRTAIEEEWDNIPQATINSLINSMWRRCVVLHIWWSHQILTGFLIHTSTFKKKLSVTNR